MPVPKKFIKVFGEKEAASLHNACVEKAKKLNINKPGKYNPHSF